MGDPTQRFSGRSAFYVRSRPGYPDAVLDLLSRECGLAADSVVADVGSGTGILSELLLRAGCRVIGVEPNAEMREAAERRLGSGPRFRSVAATAEATTLDTASVDLVTAGQAFHWFDRDRSRAEFRRVLRPGGRVAILWNRRRTTGSPFLVAYERLLVEHGTDYGVVDHTRISKHDIETLFGTSEVRLETLDNRQTLDLAGLVARLLSSSYVPAPGHVAHEAVMAEARSLFRRHQVRGHVTLSYDTLVYTAPRPNGDIPN